MLNPFINVFRKEIYYWFSGWTAFIVIFVYLLLSMGMCFYAGNFFRIDNQALYSFFRFQPDILALLVPAVTLHLWTGENRDGTFDFLLSQPVKCFELVGAKFCAAWAFGAVMLFCTLPLPIVTAQYIGLDYLNLTSAYLAVLLVFGAYAAAGAVVSALSANTALTCVGSFAAAWILLEADPSPLFSWIGKYFQGQISVDFSFRREYENLITGQVGICSLIYFSLIIIMLLWLNTVIIANRKN